MEENYATNIRGLVIDLRDKDIAIAKKQTELAQAEDNLELAETNAVLAISMDGKNAEIRAEQRKQALSSNDGVVNAKNHFRQTKEELEILNAESKALSRQFAGGLRVIEFEAAKLSLQAKGVESGRTEVPGS